MIEGQGALVNEAGEGTPLKAGDFALMNPSEKYQYRNKGDKTKNDLRGTDGVRVSGSFVTIVAYG